MAQKLESPGCGGKMLYTVLTLFDNLYSFVHVYCLKFVTFKNAFVKQLLPILSLQNMTACKLKQTYPVPIACYFWS